MHHIVTVSKSYGTYAGWPANHGAWQWGNELLVGFMIGAFDYEGVGNGLHAIKRPYHKFLARSLDGGENWDIEMPNVDFNGKNPSTIVPTFDLNDPDTIIRVCGNYDTGGEDCPAGGAFYLSTNRGSSWIGPYVFPDLEMVFTNSSRWNTSRTRVVGNEVYLSAAWRDAWGSDWTFVARHNGAIFEFDANKDVILIDRYRAVMPAVAKINETTVVALRRKGMGKNWIDIATQEDPGAPWRLIARPDELAGIANTGGFNGNPPAVAAFGDRLVCAYANRSVKSMQFVWSDDKGLTWSDPMEFDKGLNPDIGYPQLFVRPDGRGVCVYYFSMADGHPQHIRACVFDPAELKSLVI
jgi:hypothetical protein